MTSSHDLEGFNVPLVIAIVIGLVAGAVWGGAFDALVGAVLAWLAMRSPAATQEPDIDARRVAATMHPHV